MSVLFLYGFSLIVRLVREVIKMMWGVLAWVFFWVFGLVIGGFFGLFLVFCESASDFEKCEKSEALGERK